VARSTILAAQANAAAILVVTALIVFEAVERLLHPEPIAGGLVVIAAAIGLVANTASALFLHEREGHDLNMRSAVLHMVGDAATSAGVLVAGIIMVVRPDATWLDPAVSLVISLVIARQAIRLLGETADVLLESTPAGLDTDELAASIASVQGVESVHDLHVWSLSSDLRALAAHIVIDGHPTLEEAQVVGERVKDELAAHYDIGHATLELECEACATETDPCVDPVPQGGFARPRGHDHSHIH
jgi:cobalt-zinc-cadmium efflux system protein